jgi:hypothetical protein
MEDLPQIYILVQYWEIPLRGGGEGGEGGEVVPYGEGYFKLVIKKAKEKAQSEENRKCMKYRNIGSFKIQTNFLWSGLYVKG